MDEICRIVVHSEHNQTVVVSNVIYDTGVTNTSFTTPRHVYETYDGAVLCFHGCLGMG